MKHITTSVLLTLACVATGACRDEYGDRDRDVGSRATYRERDRDDDERAPDWKIDKDLDIEGNRDRDTGMDVDRDRDVNVGVDTDVADRDDTGRTVTTPGERDTLPVPGNFGRTATDWTSHRGDVNFVVGSDGFAQADRDDKPLFILYTEQGCRLCEEMAGTALKDPKVTDVIHRNFVAVLVDIRSTEGDDEDWVDKHNVKSAPRIVFADDDGDLVSSLDGSQSADAIVAAANAALARMTDTASR
jgi:hypothetical protein